MAMKKQKERKSGSRMHRVPLRERLYENWRNFIVQLYGNGGLVPTLDWRGCIGIDLVRWGGVAFEATYMMAERGRIRDDQSGNFCFTPLESRIVFDRYHRLKRQFGRSGSRESGVPVHLRPETWTGREIQAWDEPFGPRDVNMAVASLVAYWDACMAKPPAPNAPVLNSYDIPDEEFWDLQPLPKMIRVGKLPPKLERELRKETRTVPNPVQIANPPVQPAKRA